MKYIQSHHYQKALQVFQELTETYSEQLPDSDIDYCASAYSSMGYLNFYMFHQQAYAYYNLNRALELCRKHKLKMAYPSVLVNLGDLYGYHTLPNFRKQSIEIARKYFIEAFDFAIENKIEDVVIVSFLDLTSVDPPLGNYSYFLPYIKKLEQQHLKSNTPNLQFALLQKDAIKCLAYKQYSMAACYFHRQLSAIDDTLVADRFEYNAYDMLSKTWGMANRLDSAIYYGKKALETATRGGNLEFQVLAAHQLENLCKAMGEDKQAHHFHIIYLEKTDSLINNNQGGSIGELHYLYQLQHQTEVAKEAETKNRIKSIMLWSLGIVLVLVLITGGIIYAQNRKLNQRNRELYKKNVELIGLEQQKQQSEQRLANGNIKAELKERLAIRIKEVMNDAAMICRKDFTINDLAKSVESNSRYVSQIINEEYGMNFSNVLSTKRVKQALQKINGEPQRYSRYTVDAIAEEFGFKSRTTFTAFFKKTTGMSPSEYLRMVRKDMSKSK
ncbi:MAG: helix-turn-helix domain-containing protein [Prevotella sp.]|jgi:AraC-like DNA-binding protein